MFKQLVKRLLYAAGYQLNSREGLFTFRMGVDPCYDIKTILSELKYRRHLRNGVIDVIFDVGANIGQSSKIFTRHFPTARIYAFEPIQGTFEVLSNNTGSLPQIIPVPLGFGSKKEKREAYLYPASVLATCIPETPMVSSVCSSDRVVVDLDTIDSFCHEHQINSIGLLKVDTEGFDLDVIKGAKKMLIDKAIDFVYFEFFYVGDDAADNSGGRLILIHEFLKAHGYRPVAFYTDFIHWDHGAGGFNALYMSWQ